VAAVGSKKGRHVLVIAGFLSACVALDVAAQHGGVRDTVHNLSATGPGEIRALSEREICKFCHIPHNAVVPSPLWGHALSRAIYDTPELRGLGGQRGAVPQPDGASRLCLSCHDGTVALGDIGGEPSPIMMVGNQRLVAGRRGHLGTDLTGSHPISFIVRGGEAALDDVDADMGLRPLAAILSDRDVRVDNLGKMQCTTCHDPHSDD
jgi:hypothetical protein